MSEPGSDAARPGLPAPGGVRYRLSVLLQEAARELRNPALALEQLDQPDINRHFVPGRNRRVLKKRQS